MGITITGDVGLVILGFGILIGFMAGGLFTALGLEEKKEDKENKDKDKKG